MLNGEMICIFAGKDIKKAERWILNFVNRVKCRADYFDDIQMGTIDLETDMVGQAGILRVREGKTKSA